MAKARNTDPQTSHDAADSVRDISKTQQAILDVLINVPMCDERLVSYWEFWQEDFPKATPQSIRSRRAELVKMGLVEYAGYDERMTTGRYGRVWKVAS